MRLQADDVRLRIEKEASSSWDHIIEVKTHRDGASISPGGILHFDFESMITFHLNQIGHEQSGFWTLWRLADKGEKSGKTGKLESGWMDGLSALEIRHHVLFGLSFYRRKYPAPFSMLRRVDDDDKSLLSIVNCTCQQATNYDC